MVVDTPKGSRNKYKYDEKLHIWRLSKMLPLGAVFPFDFGFVPSTKGEDGDSVDAMVLTEESSFAGCVLPVNLIGVLEAEQTEKGETVRNDRLIGVVETPYNRPPYRSLQDVDEACLSEIEHFFVAYNSIEGRTFKPLGWHGLDRAEMLLASSCLK